MVGIRVTPAVGRRAVEWVSGRWLLGIREVPVAGCRRPEVGRWVLGPRRVPVAGGRKTVWGRWGVGVRVLAVGRHRVACPKGRAARIRGVAVASGRRVWAVV